MHNFKAGDVVTRDAEVSNTIFKITGITKHGIYTVGQVYEESITLRESKEQTFTFSKDSFTLTLNADVSDDPWSYDKAKRLRQEAVRAVAAYNQYIQKQPPLEPINIK